MVKADAAKTADLMSCSLDEIVKQEKQASGNGKKWNNGWKNKGWKNKGWNNNNGWKKWGKWNNNGGWKKWGKWNNGGWKKGGWKKGGGWKKWNKKKWYGGASVKTTAQGPLEQLQSLCSTHGLVPTISVEEKTALGMKIAIEIDISKLQGEKEGTTKLKQIQWGTELDKAKKSAVEELLKHALLAPHVKKQVEEAAKTEVASTNTANANDDEEETWISQSCFFSNPNLALKLFEKFIAEKNAVVTYEESGEWPKCEIKCLVNGEVRGTGTAKGPWGAKKHAIKEAYFWCKNNLKKQE